MGDDNSPVVEDTDDTAPSTVIGDDSYAILETDHEASTTLDTVQSLDEEEPSLAEATTDSITDEDPNISSGWETIEDVSVERDEPDTSAVSTEYAETSQENVEDAEAKSSEQEQEGPSQLCGDNSENEKKSQPTEEKDQKTKENQVEVTECKTDAEKDSRAALKDVECETAEVPRGIPEIFGTSVMEAVREIRFRIEQKTRLTASAGE